MKSWKPAVMEQLKKSDSISIASSTIYKNILLRMKITISISKFVD